MTMIILLNTEGIQVLICCVLYAKYYIYIQRLIKHNELDISECLTQLKQALDIENNICKNSNNEINSSNINLFMMIYK